MNAALAYACIGGSYKFIPGKKRRLKVDQSLSQLIFKRTSVQYGPWLLLLMISPGIPIMAMHHRRFKPKL
jgi:hypothetical protein